MHSRDWYIVLFFIFQSSTLISYGSEPTPSLAGDHSISVLQAELFGEQLEVIFLAGVIFAGQLITVLKLRMQ